MKSKFNGLAALSFLFAVAGVVISALLLKEDVISTAHTIFEYFPSKYGVTPSTTWEGSIILGVFTSVLQVIAGNVALSNKFSLPSRAVAALSLVASLTFDNWTDIVFRSGQLTGDLQVAIVTTLSFYTLGSEITQGLSWLVILGTWRAAISDLMWASVRFDQGIRTIGSEWQSIKRVTGSNHFHSNNDNQRGFDKNRQNNSKIHTFGGVSDEIRKRMAQNGQKIDFRPTHHQITDRKDKNERN